MRCLPQPASVLAKMSRTMLARSSMTSYWRVVSFHRSHAGSIRVNGLRSVLFAASRRFRSNTASILRDLVTLSSCPRTIVRIENTKSIGLAVTLSAE
jgi:hypothetical protein